jgi:hypothetical protein
MLTEPLKKLHHEIKDFLDNRKFGELNVFLQKYINSDIGFLRTILVITKTFREEPELKKTLNKISENLQSKINVPLC